MIIKVLDKGNPYIPKRNKVDDAGYDVYTNVDVLVPAGETRKIGLGIGVEMPRGTAAFIFPRSGLSTTNPEDELSGLICQLPPIDSGYTGEVHAIVLNANKKDILVPKGTKIGQLVAFNILEPVYLSEADFEKATADPRNTAGFGSSGK